MIFFRYVYICLWYARAHVATVHMFAALNELQQQQISQEKQMSYSERERELEENMEEEVCKTTRY